MYRVFRFPAAHAAKADILWKDDLVSRQSVTERDAKSFGLSGDDRYVIIEGSDAALAQATELLKDVAPPMSPSDADRIYRRFRAQEDEAASGMGLIFGP